VLGERESMFLEAGEIRALNGEAAPDAVTGS
jgi:hypothetical protein